MTDFGWNYPPGVTESMIPGNRPEDAALEDLLDHVPDVCPTCKQGTTGDGEYMMADHITVTLDCCVADVRCDFTPDADDADPCETELVESRGGMCRECDPPEREY